MSFDPATEELVNRALAEDVGAGDITTEATVPADARARATIVRKEPGVIFGLDVAELVFRKLDPGVEIRRLAPEGEWGEYGPVMEIEGPAAALLTGERVALNFLQRLSGVATMAARCVRAVEGTGVTILDTRKTTPGMRALEKQAVAAGGAANHRAGLYDAILIKDNHIALAGGLGAAVEAALARFPEMPVEVECGSLEEIDEALTAGAHRLLLDNMTPDRLREAVAHVAGRAVLEASGGIDLKSLPDYASTGIQFISIGALTHSAPALDLALRMEAG